MTLEVTLGNFNVMPAQAGIHDFSSANCRWIVKVVDSGLRRNDGFGGSKPMTIGISRGFRPSPE
jgi:hypothetical protein